MNTVVDYFQRKYLYLVALYREQKESRLGGDAEKQPTESVQRDSAEERIEDCDRLRHLGE